MSGQQFRAKAKSVQKLGRYGLVEQNKATGEEKRVSQRTADISFGPDRSREQAAGHRAAQRTGGAASPGKKRRKQPRPVQQTAEETVWSSTPELPEVAVPAAPSMRMAVDAPMLATPLVEEEPPPPPAPRKRRRNRKKSRQRQAAKHAPDAVRSLENQPKAAPMRNKGDTSMQNRPPGTERRISAKRPVQLKEGGGRLKFETSENESIHIPKY